MKFQPLIKYTGSKRPVSEEIISWFPDAINTYWEPFCGSCSVAFQLLHSSKSVKRYCCSDINQELIEVFITVRDSPDSVVKEYQERWKTMYSFKETSKKQEYYNSIREAFNATKNVFDFIFLSRTSFNGLIRYNSKGGFNAPFHLNRDGIAPETYSKIIHQWGQKIQNVEFSVKDFKSIAPAPNDFMFLDPPYFSTKGIYQSGFSPQEYFDWLRGLGCKYIFTYDGKSTAKDYTYDVPKDVFSSHLYLSDKISAFRKLINQQEYVGESLYANYDIHLKNN